MGINRPLASNVATAIQTGLADFDSERLAPTANWFGMDRSEHFVQFYDSDDVIVNAIAEYVVHGLRSGETCIVAATKIHLVEVEKLIVSFAGSLQTIRKKGDYIPLDAVETLAAIMVDGTPDNGLFSSVIGDIVNRAARRGSGIRVFGEMVGVLSSQGNYPAAICLEDMWNDLRKKQPFSLFCAYPMGSLKVGSMLNVCDQHSRIIPDESYTSLPTANERLRAIAMLQQRNKELEAEIAELERRISVKSVMEAA